MVLELFSSWSQATPTDPISLHPTWGRRWACEGRTTRWPWWWWLPRQGAPPSMRPVVPASLGPIRMPVSGQKVRVLHCSQDLGMPRWFADTLGRPGAPQQLHQAPHHIQDKLKCTWDTIPHEVMWLMCLLVIKAILILTPQNKRDQKFLSIEQLPSTVPAGQAERHENSIWWLLFYNNKHRNNEDLFKQTHDTHLLTGIKCDLRFKTIWCSVVACPAKGLAKEENKHRPLAVSLLHRSWYTCRKPENRKTGQKRPTFLWHHHQAVIFQLRTATFGQR